MKKVPAKVEVRGLDALRVTGDGASRDRTVFKQPWDSGRSYFYRAGPWGIMHHLRLRARGRGQTLIETSGKKDKKFWRKVWRRIERLAPDDYAA